MQDNLQTFLNKYMTYADEQRLALGVLAEMTYDFQLKYGGQELPPLLDRCIRSLVYDLKNRVG